MSILSPKPGARVESRTIVVRVRVSGRTFEAYADGRDVTRRFRGRGPVRTARLVRGRHLPAGDTNVLVSAGRARSLDADQHHFTMVRRNRGALSVRIVRERLPWAAPSIVARTKRPLRGLRISLNGRRVEQNFDEAPDGRGVSGRPGGHLGLRHGLNTLRVYALQRNGVSARRVLRFRIDGRRAIASAGRDQVAGVGDRIVLNGRASRAARARSRRASASQSPSSLQPSWRIVSAPPGSDAQLAQPDSLQPALVPDEPGTYLVRLSVAGADARSLDETEISVPAYDEPMGVPVQTITKDGGIQIGLPGGLGSKTYPRLGSWVQLLQLNPTTATPAVDSNSVPIPPRSFPSSDAGAAALLKAIEGAKGNLLVLTGQALEARGLSSAGYKSLGQAIEAMGGTVDTDGTTPNGSANLAVSGQWSVIGRTGLAPGGANQSFALSAAGVPGLLGGDRGGAGSLNGYLQSVTSAGLQFVSPENAALDTKFQANVNAPPSATQNQIKVGDQVYASSPIPGGALAVQLLVLDGSGLNPLVNQTFELYGPGGGSTNGGAIAQLNQTLAGYARGQRPGASPLVIMQDFGTHPVGGDFPASGSEDWVNDSLPETFKAFNWSGQGMIGADLAKGWNSSGAGSVAGNIGQLADSTEAHDIVANYRMPFYSQRAGRLTNRLSGGLTVVASANLYQRSEAFVKGQPDPVLSDADGRVTGVLRRNAQSQWGLSAPAPTAGLSGTNQGGAGAAFDTAELVETVMSAPSPWPCSDELPAPCPVASEIDPAMAYVAGKVFGAAVSDVREQYDNKLIDWDSRGNTLDNVVYPASGAPGFSKATFDALVGVLKGNAAQPTGEFERLANVDTAFTALEGVIAKSATIGTFNISSASSGVLTAVKQAKANRKLYEEQAEADVSSTIEDVLETVAYGLELSLVLDPVEAPALEAVPAALGVVSSLIALGEDVYAFYDTSKPVKAKYVEDDLSVIRDETQNLGNDFQARYTAIGDKLEHFREVIKTDPVKLARTDANIGARWNIDQRDEYRIRQGIVVGAKTELYGALMPVAFRQWLVSPRATDIDPGAFAFPANRSYNCRKEVSEGSFGGKRVILVNPFGKSPYSTMTRVYWNPFPSNSNTGPAAGPFTVRALIAVDDDLDLDREEDFNGLGENDTYVKGNGTKPRSSLTDPLFLPVGDGDSATEPRNLGLSKEEFFGQEGWVFKRLQCGIPR